jgi:hypothetical protein
VWRGSCVVDDANSQILIFGGRSAVEVKLQDLYAFVRHLSWLIRFSKAKADEGGRSCLQDVKRQSLKPLSPVAEDDSGPPGR